MMWQEARFLRALNCDSGKKTAAINGKDDVLQWAAKSVESASRLRKNEEVVEHVRRILSLDGGGPPAGGKSDNLLRGEELIFQLEVLLKHLKEDDGGKLGGLVKRRRSEGASKTASSSSSNSGAFASLRHDAVFGDRNSASRWSH